MPLNRSSQLSLFWLLSEKKLSFQLLFCCYPASNRLQLEEAASASVCCSNCCRTPKLSADHKEQRRQWTSTQRNNKWAPLKERTAIENVRQGTGPGNGPQWGRVQGTGHRRNGTRLLWLIMVGSAHYRAPVTGLAY